MSLISLAAYELFLSCLNGRCSHIGFYFDLIDANLWHCGQCECLFTLVHVSIVSGGGGGGGRESLPRPNCSPTILSYFNLIDLIHKWRPIYNSFVEVQISLPSLDTIQ